MKKVLLSLILVALSAMTFAQQWTSINKNTPSAPEVKLISSSEKEVVVEFTLGGFNLTSVDTQNGIQNIVSVPKMSSMLEAGSPDLPQFPVPAIIGDMAEMNVSIVKSAFTDYQNVEVALRKATSAVRSTLRLCLTPMVPCIAKTLSILPLKPILKRLTSSAISVAKTSWCVPSLTTP
jgi:hypothetical protein